MRDYFTTCHGGSPVDLPKKKKKQMRDEVEQNKYENCTPKRTRLMPSIGKDS